MKAWRNAKALAEAAAQSLERIAPGSPTFQLAMENIPKCKETKKGTDEFRNCMRIWIAGNHIAYTQLFGANPQFVTTGMFNRATPVAFNLMRSLVVTENFRKIVNDVDRLDAANRDNQQIYLTASNRVTDISNGGDVCHGGTYGKSFQRSTYVGR